MCNITTTTSRILQMITRATNISRDNLLDDNRGTADASDARMLCFWLLYEAGYKTKDIGRIFGRNDATVLHGLRRVKARRQNSPEWAALTDRLLRELQAESSGLDMATCRSLAFSLADAIDAVAMHPGDSAWVDRASAEAERVRRELGGN